LNSDFEYFNSDDFKMCLKEYESAQKKGTAMFLDVNDFADIADYYNQMGNSRDAMVAIRKGLDIFPGEAVLLSYVIRNDLHTSKRLDEAKKHLEMIDDTSDPEYFYCMIEIMLTEEKDEEADNAIRQKYEEIDDEEHDNFVVDIAEIYTDYCLLDKADEWLEKTCDKESLDYKEIVGRIAMAEGNDAKAIEIYQQLLDENPFSCEYWDSLATLQIQTQRFNDAIASCEYSLAISPNNHIALRNKANALYTTGLYEEAIATYSQLAKIAPDDAAVFLSIGAAMMNLGRYAEAVEQLKTAYKKDNSLLKADIVRELVIGLSRLRRTEEALKYIEEYSKVADNTSETNVLKGHVYLEAGNIDKAIAYFGKAVNDPDSDSGTTMRIAISFYDTGETEMAYNLFKEIYYNINEDKALPYIALCAKDLGKHDVYLACLKEACEKVPDETRLVLGDMFPVELSVDEYYDYEKNK